MAAVVPSIEPLEDSSNLAVPKAALTPPTSEEWNKADGDSSDLSDLDIDGDDDGDDIGEITPDHYYGDGRIPVFKPTMDQFRSFKKFVDKIDKYGMKSGIVKVIPPKEWRESLPNLDEAVKTIKVKNPITQEFVGTHGTYTQANIEKQRSYNLPQWKALTEETNHQPPARRGERRRNQEKVVRGAATRPVAKPKPSPASTVTPKPKRGRGRPRRNTGRKDDTESVDGGAGSGDDSQPQVPPTPTSPEEKSKDFEDEEEESPIAKRSRSAKGKKQTPQSSPAPKAKGCQPKSVSERRKYNRAETTEQVDEEAFKEFVYGIDNHEDYTPERCQELETAYWKSLTFAPPMYGADMPGSLFDDTTTSWNVAKLENLLDVLGTKVPGVNTAYLYLGMWKATFAWHLEDVDLYSINYIHFGAPKQWYSISQEDARRFESAMRTIWPNDAKHCSQFLRHKTYLISPALLKNQFNIEVNKLVHYEGEFVITFPYGYHSGYNIGYNCAESVNFATEAWLDYGKIAKKCNCEADSVWVDVGEIERKLRGEPTPEYYEETDDEDMDENEYGGDLPSPPASVKGNLKLQIRKRKRDSTTKAPQRKVKRLKIRLKIAHAEPCILCPNDMPFERLLPTDNGKKAHELCALYTPELYIWDQDGPERICDIDKINKARFDLKCSFCRSKKGSCFQCSARKCTRAYHATCAAAAGVQVEYGPTPWYGEGGIEYKSEDYDFRCRWHRTKRPKNVDSDALEKNSLIRNKAMSLKTGEAVQVQHLGGDVFAGLVVENRLAERTVLIDVLPHGDRVEVEWKYVLELDPAESQMVRPSADARDLPQDFDKQKIRSQPSQNGPPVQDDPFGDREGIYKWAEFHTGPAPHNETQVKVQLDKDNQIWYYLGKTSTEAKAQFTEDLQNPRHNIKGNFLETVKPPPVPVVPVPRKTYSASYPTGVNYHALNGAMVASRQIPPQARTEKPYEYKPRDGQVLSMKQFFNHLAEQGFSGTTQISFGNTNSKAENHSKSPSISNNYQRPPQPSPFKSPSAISTSHQLPPHPPWNTPGQFTSPYAQIARPAPMANMMGSTNFPPRQGTLLKRDHFDMEHLKRIAKYPYLEISFWRKPKAYDSPYPSEAGFSEAYVRLIPKSLQAQSPTPDNSSLQSKVPLPVVNVTIQQQSASILHPHQTDHFSRNDFPPHADGSLSDMLSNTSAQHSVTITPQHKQYHSAKQIQTHIPEADAKPEPTKVPDEDQNMAPSGAMNESSVSTGLPPNPGAGLMELVPAPLAEPAEPAEPPGFLPLDAPREAVTTGPAQPAAPAALQPENEVTTAQQIQHSQLSQPQPSPIPTYPEEHHRGVMSVQSLVGGGG